jgi:flagellar hook assembly protein FlgD
MNTITVKGQKVKILSVPKSPNTAVSITWDGSDQNNNSVSSGVYIYRLHSGKNVLASRKMILIK